MMTAVTPDALIPQRHPIRCIKPMVDRALAQLSPTFGQMYAQNARASIPPASMGADGAVAGVNERQFCEKLEYGLLFKLFPDLNIMDHSFEHSMFAPPKSIAGSGRSREFLMAHRGAGRRQGLLSVKHFSVDGTRFGHWDR